MSADRSYDPVIRAYSNQAAAYDSEENLRSCWGAVNDRALAEIDLKERYRRVLDVGCGTGHALRALAARASRDVELIGVEPAEKARSRAKERLESFDNVRIVDGRFEELPVDTGSIDYLYSILAFHWTTDLESSVSEIRRVLGPSGDMDLVFVGRDTGQEFTRTTTPVFLRHMGPIELLKSARMRKHLSADEARELFARHFPGDRLTVSESMNTYHDDLEGHWSWWVARTAGHFAKIPDDKRSECDREVREAIASLETGRGIPYTVHELRVQVRS